MEQPLVQAGPNGLKPRRTQRGYLCPVRDRLNRRASPALAMVVYPPTPNRVFFGKKIIFSGNLLHLILISFNYGYVECFAYQLGGVYCTLLTGNLIQGSIAVAHHDKTTAVLSALMVVGNGMIGSMLSAFVLDYTGDLRKTLCVIALAVICSFLIVDAIGYRSYVNSGYDVVYQSDLYYLFLLSIPQGMLFHWSLKTTFTTALITVNMHKIFESLYRFAANIGQGGAKLRGDVIIIISCILGLWLGAIFSLLVFYHLSFFRLAPLAALSLFHFVYADIPSLVREEMAKRWPAASPLLTAAGGTSIGGGPVSDIRAGSRGRKSHASSSSGTFVTAGSVAAGSVSTAVHSARRSTFLGKIAQPPSVSVRRSDVTGIEQIVSAESTGNLFSDDYYESTTEGTPTPAYFLRVSQNSETANGSSGSQLNHSFTQDQSSPSGLSGQKSSMRSEAGQQGGSSKPITTPISSFSNSAMRTSGAALHS